jgi:hypothetical protein
MTEPSSPKYQFPGDIDDLRSVADHRTQLRTEQQLDPMINRKMIMPNPLDPMGNIEAEGRAMRSISSGRMPTWVLMAAWGTIGLGTFLTLGVALHTLTAAFQAGRGDEQIAEWFVMAIGYAPMILISLLVLTILFRGTWRKR